MNKPYDPKTYWESRLNEHFDLQGVGHIGFSKSYNYWLYRRKKRCIESVFRDQSLRGKDVLDIGCGTGFFIEWYLKKGANIYGIDIAEVSIQKLSNKYQGNFVVMDITDSSYHPPKKFDIVNIWDVIYHIVDNMKFHQCLENIAKSCKRGGLLLFTDRVGSSSDIQEAQHVKFRCLHTYQTLLPNFGFELIKVLPLYNLLNRHLIPRYDNFLAPFYFIVDNYIKHITKNNLCLCLWQREGETLKQLY